MSRAATRTSVDSEVDSDDGLPELIDCTDDEVVLFYLPILELCL